MTFNSQVNYTLLSNNYTTWPYLGTLDFNNIKHSSKSFTFIISSYSPTSSILWSRNYYSQLTDGTNFSCDSSVSGVSVHNCCTTQPTWKWSQVIWTRSITSQSLVSPLHGEELMVLKFLTAFAFIILTATGYLFHQTIILG